MAKPPKRRLKVFQAQFGFYDTVVAVASQAAALRAWGTRQNLFASGQARLTDDAQAMEAAISQPQTVLKRAVGTTDPFALKPAHLPILPDEPKPKTAPSKPAKPRDTPLQKPPADRAALDAAEAALKALDDRRRAEEGAWRRRQDDLDAEREASQQAYVKSRKAADAAVAEARQAFRKAGGDG